MARAERGCWDDGSGFSDDFVSRVLEGGEETKMWSAAAAHACGAYW